jgi:predicted secreted Zn-dependent protease
MELKVRLKRDTYPVVTPGNTHSEFYNKVFGSDGLLCKAIGEKTGSCKDAVAATSWEIEVQKGLYDESGKKRTLACTCNITKLLPEWQPKNKTSAPAASILSFIAATETHENGHAVLCESLAHAIGRLAKQMPASVPPSKVHAFNAAFAEFTLNFYEKLARKTDETFDNITGHGAAYEAELGERE